jgi:hypothetical protein
MIVQQLLGTILVSAIKLLLGFVWTRILCTYVSDLNAFLAWTERELAFEEALTC